MKPARRRPPLFTRRERFAMWLLTATWPARVLLGRLTCAVKRRHVVKLGSHGRCIRCQRLVEADAQMTVPIDFIRRRP